ncbi:hypothetical protein K439DRAFT_1612064 [Ramaria rubella]|nr:hypothetical protein K439DRAFT_1612064 [Ramaria rubella]
MPVISAIAARKAAQAAQQQAERLIEPTDILISSSNSLVDGAELSPSAITESESEAPSPRKRKTKGQHTSQKQYKKLKKLRNADIGRMRYFEANQPIEGFDDDILESDLLHYHRRRQENFYQSTPLQKITLPKKTTKKPHKRHLRIQIKLQ